MLTLGRPEAQRYYQHLRDGVQADRFKAEVRQDYSGEDMNPSLERWLHGDRVGALALLTSEILGNFDDELRAKTQQGVSFRRVRVVAKPLTPYTAWEFECFRRFSIPAGEQILCVDQSEILDLRMPDGDWEILDDKYVTICHYNETGRMVEKTFLHQGVDDIEPYLDLRKALLHRAQPFQC